MKFYGIENGKIFELKGTATITVEKQIIGNGSTRNFIVPVSEKLLIAHVSLYLVGGNNLTRVKDNLYTIIINQTTPTQFNLNFTTTPATGVVYKALITATHIP